MKGITTHFERLLREKGIGHWDDFLEKESALSGFPRGKLDKIKMELVDSKQALEEKNLRYFQDRLHPREHWRLAELGKIGFVDIETTGLSRWSDEITVLGIYDGKTSHLYVYPRKLKNRLLALLAFQPFHPFLSPLLSNRRLTQGRLTPYENSGRQLCQIPDF